MKMHDDLLDAVKWAVDNKVGDPTKIAIMEEAMEATQHLRD